MTEKTANNSTSTLTLDLIELDDKKTPFAVADEILRQNPDLIYPVPLEAIAELAGITSISELTTDGFEGMLITNAEKSLGAIMIKAATSPRRRRFTIAHELGHFLLPWHRQETFSCKSSDIKDNGGNRSRDADVVTIEAEANAFASELLMPRDAFTSIVSDFAKTPKLIDLADLSDTFDVSFEAVVHRYKALTDYPLAFVFSHNNIVRYWLKSSTMPYSLNVRKDYPLPARSPSRMPDDYISEWHTLPTQVWFEPHAELVLPKQVLEQTIYQSAGYKVTLLYLESLYDLMRHNHQESDDAMYEIE